MSNEEEKVVQSIELPESLPGERWAPFQNVYISSVGRVVSGATGKILKLYDDGRCLIGGKNQYLSVCMAKAFHMPNHDKLLGHDTSYVVNVREGAPKPCRLEDLTIRTRADVGHENGQKSRKSERFQEISQTDITMKMASTEHVIVAELNMIVFADAFVYNRASQRFICFTLNGKSNMKPYYHTILKDGVQIYQHKLVCFAFHKIEGKTTYDEYKVLQANHKDGNTLNNHKDNLEWTSQSENMQHAYDNNLNNKVQSVLQHKRLPNGSVGELVKEHISIAEASRATGIPEHAIRTACGVGRSYNSSKYREFFWFHKDPDKALEYSKRFSANPTAGESSLQSKVQKRSKLQ